MRNFCAGCPPFWLHWHLGRSFCLDPAAHWPHLGVVWGAEQFMPNCQTKLRPAEVFDRGLWGNAWRSAADPGFLQGQRFMLCLDRQHLQIDEVHLHLATLQYVVFQYVAKYVAKYVARVLHVFGACVWLWKAIDALAPDSIVLDLGTGALALLAHRAAAAGARHVYAAGASSSAQHKINRSKHLSTTQYQQISDSGTPGSPHSCRCLVDAL